jgi:galactokinase
VPSNHSAAFAPGRVNLIGEHTDYNQGLALPFAISEGVTVSADASHDGRIQTYARDLDERDAFGLDSIEPAPGWRAFVRGVAAELQRAGLTLQGAALEIVGSVPQGAGLSSSAALEVALCLALAALCEATEEPNDRRHELSRIEIAKLCAHVENDWVGAHTGLLDQLASLFGAADHALRIDFRTLDVQPVPLILGNWRIVVIDSGERHTHAGSGYNERRSECASACELLGVQSLRDVSFEQAARLPAPLDQRACHVLAENQRVQEAVDALAQGDLPAVGKLLSASHRSLRDLYNSSTPAVESTVERVMRNGAAGARMVGGGFGGNVLALFAPGVPPPSDAREVRPGPGAHLLDSPI